MPLVSVITCTYNRARLIGETIQSVLHQTLRDFEYIVVDDGSTDNTEEVVRAFNDARVSYFRLPNTNGHLSRLRNFGIKKSRGKYIAFIDSDDLWLPGKLHEQITLLEHNRSAGFSFTDIELFREQEILKISLYKRHGAIISPIFEDLVQNKMVVCTTTLVFRMACLRKTGFQDEQLMCGDFDFNLALASHFTCAAVYKPMVRVRRHDQNFTSRLPLSRANDVMTSYHKLVDHGLVTHEQIRKTLGRLCYSFAVEFVRQNDHEFAVDFLKKSIRYNSLNWKTYPRLIMAMLRLPY